MKLTIYRVPNGIKFVSKRFCFNIKILPILVLALAIYTYTLMVDRSDLRLEVEELECVIQELDYLNSENDHLRTTMWELWRQTEFDGVTLTDEEMLHPHLQEDFEDFQEMLTKYVERREGHK